MASAVPSLEGSLFLTDPQSIIAYTLRRYFRQPKNTIPILDDLIISLPYQVAKFSREPDNLVSNIQSDLQNVLSRIFKDDRSVIVNASYKPVDTIFYTVSISVVYTTLSGEPGQTGTTISVNQQTKRLVIPEDTVRTSF